MLPHVVDSAQNLAVLWIEPIAAPAPADNLVHVEWTPARDVNQQVFGLAGVIISGQHFFPNLSALFQFLSALPAHRTNPFAGA